MTRVILRLQNETFGIFGLKPDWKSKLKDPTLVTKGVSVNLHTKLILHG